MKNQYCGECGKYLNSDGVCNDCGLPGKDAFLKALSQAIPGEKQKGGIMK